jgi:hypothetical protein
MEDVYVGEQTVIAAAPDLLAALRNLLADATALGIDDSPFSGVAIEARNAIAKATGKWVTSW